jgi:hypothetical protein
MTKGQCKDIIKNITEFFDFYGGLTLIGILCLIIAGLIYIAFIPNPLKRLLNEKDIYRNEKCIIVGTNEAAQDFTHNKFHQPIVIKVWLVQRVNDTTQFAELTSYDNYDHWYITNEMWYGKGIGDTLYFKYIRKNRFFTINKK